MDELALKEQLILGEDSTRQFKCSAKRSTSIAAEIVAFLNSGGGKLFIGINDDGSISGLSKKELEDTGKLIAEAATVYVRPPHNVHTTNISTEQGFVLLVDVPNGVDKPYCDQSGCYWVKNGPDKRRISRDELIRLFQEGGKIYAETRVIAGSTIINLDLDAFKNFYEKKYQDVIPDDEKRLIQILENLKLFDGGKLTLAGALFFGLSNQHIIPEFHIDAIWFKGLEHSGTRYYDNRKINGTLTQQYEQAMGFVRNTLSRIQKNDSFNSSPEIEIPELVFEEILTNALIHRDYYIADSIKLFIFDDRIEVHSPGKLTNSLTVEQIRRGIRRSRNEVIASFAPDLLNYRGIGSGILRAIKAWPSIDILNDVEGERFSVIIPKTADPVSIKN